MVQEVKTTYADLELISNQLSDLSDRVNAVLDEIRTKRGNLVNEWRGFGYGSFSAEMDGDIIPALGRLGLALASAQAQVKTISTQILSTEDDAGQRINGVTPPPLSII